MNGLEIKDRSDFAELYNDNPGLAIGILYENTNELKKRCACRYDQCKKEQFEILNQFKTTYKFGRLKNWIMQSPGAIVTSAITTYIILKIWLEAKYSVKLPSIKDLN